MKELLAIFIIVTCSALAAHTQTPQYFWSKYPGSFGGFYTWGGPVTSGGSKSQFIYHPDDFPTAPSGHIVNLYLRVGGTAAPLPSIYYNFTVKMGYTMADSFDATVAKPDTFKTGLDTVFFSAAFSVSGTDTLGKWIKIPLIRSFYYNGKGSPEARNVIIEFSFGPKQVDNGFGVLASVAEPKRGIGGAGMNATVAYSTFKALDLGFDFGPPINVVEISNIASLELFPNPANNGKFNISFITKKPVGRVHVAITDIAGKQVFVDQFANAGTSFWRTIDAGTSSKGMYFIRVEADGEVVNRRMVIQ